MIRSIRLIPEYGEEILLKTFPGQWIYRVEDVLETHIRVYENKPYAMILESESEIEELSIYLNNEKIEAENQNGYITFSGATSSRLFHGQIGFAHFSLCVRFEGSNAAQWYFSEFASIMIRSNETNRAVTSMLQYIYDNQSIALQGKQHFRFAGEDTTKNNDDFWSQLQLLEEIVNTYERNYGYFKANTRSKLEPMETVDRAEKLQSIDSKTLSYMVQHPEYLRKEMTGIRYGRYSFLPSRTLMIQNQVTYNIYENQVVLSFLKKVLIDAEDLTKTIDKYLSSFLPKDTEDDGYILSSELLFFNARELLSDYRSRILSVRDKLSYFYIAYSQLLIADEADMTIQPDPTPIFMNVPQYNQVYTCINKWFGKRGYDFRKELALLSFFSIPQVYEVYVLLRILKAITNSGFELIETKTIKYIWDGLLFRNRNYHNYYKFIHNKEELTVYLEPIISDECIIADNRPNLYRNNSIVFSRDKALERQHNMYTPDYVIKMVGASGKEKYVICDAKYSYIEKIRNTLVPELSFKYLFSMSPASGDSSIVGMYILYGLVDEHNAITSVYDKEGPRQIVPFADLVPVSERIQYADQEEILRQVIDKALKS